MASPVPDGTIACDAITSLTDLLTQAKDGVLNIENEIQRCPAVCEVAWGPGNPDLSGIGVSGLRMDPA
jgi:hypothetical protein